MYGTRQYNWNMLYFTTETEWWFRSRAFLTGADCLVDTTMFIRQSAFRFRSA